MSEYIQLRQQDFSFFGKRAKIKGELYLSGTTHLASSVEGEIRMQDKSELTLEHEAIVKGDIHCHNLEVYGEVQGNIHSTGLVTFHPTSNFTGKVSSQKLIIKPGAELNMDGHTVEN
jgi:cytoskeletal protein CcmA (bactofilin family)